MTKTHEDLSELNLPLGFCLNLFADAWEDLVMTGSLRVSPPSLSGDAHLPSGKAKAWGGEEGKLIGLKMLPLYCCSGHLLLYNQISHFVRSGHTRAPKLG